MPQFLADCNDDNKYWLDLKRKLAEGDIFSEMYDKIVQLALVGIIGREIGKNLVRD